MDTSQKRTGNRGESIAVDYLRSHGYRILERNWHCQYGELDIIAEVIDEIIFVEVRTRHAENTEAAFASISGQKVERLLKAVYQYLNSIPDGDGRAWRVDVIGIALPKGKPPVIKHVENALGW